MLNLACPDGEETVLTIGGVLSDLLKLFGILLFVSWLVVGVLIVRDISSSKFSLVSGCAGGVTRGGVRHDRRVREEKEINTEANQNLFSGHRVRGTWNRGPPEYGRRLPRVEM